jgi:hypothetical protein
LPQSAHQEQCLLHVDFGSYEVSRVMNVPVQTTSTPEDSELMIPTAIHPHNSAGSAHVVEQESKGQITPSYMPLKELGQNWQNRQRSLLENIIENKIRRNG